MKLLGGVKVAAAERIYYSPKKQKSKNRFLRAKAATAFSAS